MNPIVAQTSTPAKSPNWRDRPPDDSPGSPKLAPRDQQVISSPIPGLSPQDYYCLSVESAISDEIIKARGYYTVTDPAELEKLGYAPFQCQVPVRVDPQISTAGVQVGTMIRHRTPRRNAKTGKLIKYEQKLDGLIMIDAGPNNVDLRNPNVPLHITEGSKKRDALASKGFCAISIPGVWGFLRQKLVIPDFDDIDLLNRDVIVDFDSDVIRKKNVADALHRLIGMVQRRGARSVKASYLPDTPGGEKMGVDDFLASRSVEDYLATIREIPKGNEATIETTNDITSQRIAALEQENAELKAKIRETRQVLSDKRLTAQERICAIVFKEETIRIQQHGSHHLGLGPRGTVQAVDETGALVLNRQHAASLAGTTPKSWDDFVSKAVQVGLAERAAQTRIRTGERVNRRGEIIPAYESTARIRPKGDMGTFLTDLLDRLPEKTPRAKPTPKNFCAEHPTADVIRRTTYTCSVCDATVAPMREVWVDAGMPPEIEPERPDRGWYDRAVNDHHPVTAHIERNPELAFQDAPKVTPENAPLNDLASPPHVTIETPLVHPEISLARAQAALTAVDHSPLDDRGARNEFENRLAEVARSRGRKPDPKPTRTMQPTAAPVYDQGVPF